jgi:acetyl esterase/lipase
LLALELRESVDSLGYRPPTSFDELDLQRMALPALGSTPNVDRTDLTIGERGISVRLHRPSGLRGARPCIMSIHGGGLVGGAQEMDDYVFEIWASRLGVLGVSLDYRLAPEAPYPAALDDCADVAKWVVAHAAELDVDLDQFGVMGASAGGGLAAALALRFRDEGQNCFKFMILDAPMLDDRLVTPSSQLDNLAIWSREANRFAWDCYLGQRIESDDVSFYAAPARAEDLGGLPPTLLTVGSADGFRDEGIAFAGKLAQQGVAVDLRVYAGAPHGYGMFQSWPTAARAARDTLDWAAQHIGADTREDEPDVDCAPVVSQSVKSDNEDPDDSHQP